ncbi:TIGR01777 family oxidoreductase [Sinobaca sp. H24]|uniref:TIGR01777 family oxidoreductase n=1 Tax=Sinobaca sp. H24 TaxID=2923376 RepID=UPI00207A8499|nr:TIGR01777 family oxidoreductase [Sinobaca sp. H24]
MNIAISGGTGLVGSALTGYLTAQGHHVYILTRNTENKQNKERITFVEWLGSSSTPEKELPDLDAVINLAGASIQKRWTDDHKKAILQSRLSATQEIERIIGALPSKPEVLINASAVGYYGISEEDVFTESSGPAERNFLQEVSEQWEEKARTVEKHGVRLVLARFGLILDGEEGALPMMMLPYKLYTGGPIGNGRQWYSWIHLRDVVEMIEFALETKKVKGPMNITAPEPLRMDEFGRTLGAVMRRPHWLPVPGIALQKSLGEMSVLIVNGQKALPEKALEAGYTFSYSKLEPALKDLLDK